MTPGQATFLGVLQGLGEFLPISSSGHLIVVPWALGWPDHSLAFDVGLHLGTLVAVLAAFATDWWLMAGGFVRGLSRGRPFGEPQGRLLGLLALATIPGGVAGLALEEWAETTFRAPLLVACTMAGLGALLLIADRRARGTGEALGMSVRDAVLIGLAQAFALVPGVSRSGATITAALVLGYRRDESARFSFLLATPITAGAALLKVPELLSAGPERAVAAWGMLAAAAVGLLAIRFLLGWVRRHDYAVFAHYRFVFAAATLALVLVRRWGLG